MKKIFTLLALILQCALVAAQQQYPHFTQTYSNPYLINPSFICLDNSLEINASYRQNLVKVQDAPSSLQFDIQYPIDPKISLAINIYNDRSILLNQTAALATFGYKINVAPYHYLGFGLSAGVMFNQLNRNSIPEVDLADPAVAAIQNNSNFTGQFGAHYQYKKWMFGFSLMDLVANSPFLNDELISTSNFTPFRDKAVYLSTRIKVSNSIHAQPVVIYRTTDLDTEFIEGNLLFNFKNHVDIGGGYRTDFGPQLLLRVRISKVRVGYAYQMPSSGRASSFGATNEFQGKILFKDFIEPASEKKSTTPTTEPLIKDTEVAQPKENPITPEVTEKKEDEVAVKTPVQEEVIPKEVVKVTPEQPKVEVQKEETPKEEAPKEESGRKYKVVIGTFRSAQHADKFLKKVQDMGFNAAILQPKGSPYFYIHLTEYEADEHSYDSLLQIREKTGFADAWYKEF